MRKAPNTRLDKFRLNHPRLGSSPPGENFGWFEIPTSGGILRVMSSGEDETHGWEHVSVSMAHGCPSWGQMCRVKDLFWGDDETVVQFHPPKSEYVNRHRYCLHLWRPLGVNIPTPPKGLVG